MPPNLDSKTINAVIAQVKAVTGGLAVRFNSGRWESFYAGAWHPVKDGAMLHNKITEILGGIMSAPGSGSPAPTGGGGGGSAPPGGGGGGSAPPGGGGGGSAPPGGGGGGSAPPGGGGGGTHFEPPKPWLADKFHGHGIESTFNQRYSKNGERIAWGGDDDGWMMEDANGNLRNLNDKELKKLKKARSAALDDANNPSWNNRTPRAWKGALGNSVSESILSGFLPYSGAAAVGIGLQSVKGAAAYSGNIVQSISDGIKGASSGLISAGESIVGAVTQGILGSLGRTGAGIGGLMSAGVGGAKDLLGAGINTVTGVAKTGASILGGVGAIGLGGIGAIGGSLLGLGVGSAPGGLVGAALGAGAGMLLAKIVAGIADRVGGILGTLGEAFGKFGEVAGKAITSVIAIIQDGLESALKMSSSVMNMSRGGAYSIGGSYSMINTLGAFGMSPQAVSGVFANTNAMYMAPRANVWGVGGISSNGNMDGETFASSVRNRFQGFVGQYGQQMGTALGRAMLQSLGIDNPEMLRMVNMSDKNFNRQIQNSKELGLSPTAMKKWDEDISLLQTTIGQFIEWAKINVGQAFLPIIQSGLEKGIQFMKDHKQDFIDAITAAGKWLYVDLPVLLKSGFSEALGVFVTFTSGLAEFVKEFRTGTETGFVGTLKEWLFAMDKFAEGAKMFGAVAQAAGKGIWDIAKTLKGLGDVIDGVATLIPQLLAGLTVKILDSPFGKLLEKIPGFGFTTGVAKWAGNLVNDNTGTNLISQGFDTLKGVFNDENIKSYAKIGNTIWGDPEDDNPTFGTGAYQAFSKWQHEYMSKNPEETGIERGAKALNNLYEKMNKTSSENERAEREKQFNSVMKELTETLKNGVTVKVDSNVKVEATSDMMAKVANYTALATWRKMDMAAGG